MAGLDSLPSELQQEIFSYIPSREDLKSLCRVCKAVSMNVLPHLYGNVILTISQLNASLAEQMHGRNPGLQYVRHVTIVPLNLHEDYDHDAHGPALGHLLNVLPKDGLLTFNLETEHVLPHDIAQVLRLRQALLTNFVLNGTKAARIIDSLPDQADVANITALSLYITPEHDLHKAAAILRQAINVRTLSITMSNDIIPFPQRPDYRGCVEVLFSPWLQTLHVPRLKLKRLNVRRFYFEDIASLLACALDAQQLYSLTLSDCCDYSNLLDNLCHTQFVLRELTLVNTVDLNPPAFVQAILNTFAGLRKVRLSNADPLTEFDWDWSVLQSHGPTLRELWIDHYYDETSGFDDDQDGRRIAAFRELASTCSNLKQLALRSPIFCHNGKPAYGFLAFQESLKLFHNLTTLRLFIHIHELGGYFSDCDDKNCFQPTGIQHAARMVYKTADQIFATLSGHCPHLIALAIDAKVCDFPCGNEHLEWNFARAKQEDIFGRVTWVASPVTRTELKLLTPENDILVDQVKFWVSVIADSAR